MDFLNEIWTTITKNRSRSILTGFGIFWGILMLLVLVGLGDSMVRGIFTVTGVAVNSCFVGTSQTGKPYMGLQKGREWFIVNEDLPVLRRMAPSAEIVSAICFGGQRNNNVRHGKQVGTYHIVGVDEYYPQILLTPLLYGRYLNQQDVREKRKVCVIGLEVYQELFPEGGNPIGQLLRVDNISYQVVGVKKASGNALYIGGPPNREVGLPVSVVQQVYNYGDVLGLVVATAKPGVPAAQVEEELKTTMRQLHNVAPDDEQATWSMNMEESFKAVESLGIGLQALVWFIGIGMLISGAVGVSNIMLVTVRERTKEIGIRRALGASPRVIVRQILAESTLLTLLAGVFGILGSVGVLQLLGIALAGNETFDSRMQISFGVAVGALGLLVGVGLLAGLLPARRALAIRPIEALSEE